MAHNFVSSKFPEYLKALRPWSLPVSLTPQILGTLLAYKLQNSFDAVIFLMTLLIVWCVHLSGNLVNTYYDFKRGVDNKKSEDRTLVDKILTTKEVLSLTGLFYGASGIFYLILAGKTRASLQLLSFAYGSGVAASFFYTGGIGFKYKALGDIVVMLAFGPLIAIFAYLTQCGGVSWVPIFYDIPIILLSETVLYSNNVRDVTGDQAAGILTLAMLLGPTMGYVVFCLLLFIPYAMFLTFALKWSWLFAIPLITFFEAVKIEQLYRSTADKSRLLDLPGRIAQLVLVTGLLFIAAIAAIDNSHLPFL